MNGEAKTDFAHSLMWLRFELDGNLKRREPWKNGKAIKSEKKKWNCMSNVKNLLDITTTTTFTYLYYETTK